MGTCARPGASYIEPTLANLRRSGWPGAQRILVIDSMERTRNQTGVACLEAGLATGAEWILFLEDDIQVCADFLGSVDRWIDQRPQPAAPTLYTFYCPFGRASYEGMDGAWDYPLHLFNGCQAFALRSEDASGALEYLWRLLPTWGSPGGFDRLLSAWLLACGGQILASVPSFVQHVGYQTAMGYPHWHQSPTWPGPEWSYPVGRPGGLTEGCRQT